MEVQSRRERKGEQVAEGVSNGGCKQEARQGEQMAEGVSKGGCKQEARQASGTVGLAAKHAPASSAPCDCATVNPPKTGVARQLVAVPTS